MANDALLQAALTAARAGDLEEAAVLFARLVKEEPSSEQGWLGLGFCFSDNKQREYCFKRVLAINPNNMQARQSLGLLESPRPTQAPPYRPAASPVSAPKPSEPQTRPPVSPFTTEDTSLIGKSEPVILPTRKAPDGNQKAIIVEKNIEVVPVPAEPVQAEKPGGEIPKPKRTVKPLAIILPIIIILLLVCTAGIAYLFLSGKAAQLLPAISAPTLTATQTPTPAPTPTNTDTDTPTATLTPTPAPPTLTPTLAIKPTIVYTASFAKTACTFASPQGVTVTCGFVSVPEDRTNPRTNTIQLAVAIYHSTSANPAPDPVIFLQGGPGGQAVQLSADDYDILVKPFLAKRDFITFDQRGTGLSKPALGCDELENVYKQDVSGQIPASSRDYIYTNAFRSCHGAMVIGGIELNSYTTVASSDDIKDIVNILGYKQVDLYGASYGTRLALVAMRDHPEIVRSAVLDSVVPVEVKLFNEDPIRDNSALQAMFDGCAAEASCNKAYPDLKTVFWDLVDQLEAKPITISGPQVVGSNNETIDGSSLIDLVIGLLKYSPTIGYGPDIIYKIKAGDYSSFVAMQASLPYEFEDINLGLYISMTCHEQILSTTPQDLQASRNPQDDTSKYISLPFFQDAQALFDACKIWGSVPPAPGENDAVVSAIPALIIEGKYDPATPPIFGKQVAANLSHSFYMEFSNQGHTPSATDTSGCATETMVTFFGNPAQEPDMTCLSVLKGVDFSVP